MQIFGRDRNTQKRPNSSQTLFQHQLDEKATFGTAASVTENSIVNLSKYDLSDTEKFVLARGLEFCLSPSKINRKEVFAEFEVLIRQLGLLQHTP